MITQRMPTWCTLAAVVLLVITTGNWPSAMPSQLVAMSQSLDCSSSCPSGSFLSTPCVVAPAPIEADTELPPPPNCSFTLINDGGWFLYNLTNNNTGGHGSFYNFSRATTPAWASFQFVVPEPGVYTVLAGFPWIGNRKNVTYTIVTGGGGNFSLLVDQSRPRNGTSEAYWMVLGNYSFTGAGAVCVESPNKALSPVVGECNSFITVARVFCLSYLYCAIVFIASSLHVAHLTVCLHAYVHISK